MNDTPIEDAARIIEESEAILIGAGAGMGVDSGLPDFRGNDGFWEAYPPMKRLGLSFYDLANPRWFVGDPERAWGFYGHRRNLYRTTKPHFGFDLLKRWSTDAGRTCFVFTSNVDGHFQKAGFSETQIIECHGSIESMQCTAPCDRSIWRSDARDIEVDLEQFRAAQPLPRCPHCQRVSRPNILMFGDTGWIPDRTEHQIGNYESWLKTVGNRKLAVIEIGAGRAVPTVRYECERIAYRLSGTLIRINPRESQIRGPGISIEEAGLTALKQIQDHLG